MKIIDVKTVLLTGPSTNDPFLRQCRKRRSAAFIEIYTDSDIIGIGETYAGYFCPEIVPEVVNFFKPILIGQNVSNIPQIWGRMYHCGNFWCRVGLGVSVINGIEAALWDAKGKLEGLAVCELLGGSKHEKLPCYATGGPSNYPKDELKKKLDHYLSLGFKGVKLAAGSFSIKDGWFMPELPAEAADFEADKMSFARSCVGKDIALMLDGHMGNSTGCTWDFSTALAVMKSLEPFDLFFFEEPLHYTKPWDYAELCRQTSIPIAGGECLTASYEWQIFLKCNSFDIGQPDASYTGGLGEFMKVASMLEEKERKIATHSWGAGGSLMQNIHCGFACSNTAILEVAPDFAGLHSEVIQDFVMKDGCVYVPEKPGLGIVLTDTIKNKYPFVPGSGEFNDVPGKILKD